MYKTEDERKNKKGYMHIVFSKSIPQIISAQPNPKDDPRRNILNKNSLKKKIITLFLFQKKNLKN